MITMLVVAYLSLCLLLCPVCHFASPDSNNISNVGGGVPKNSIREASGGADNDSTIQSITSQITSWMKDERRNNKRNINYEDDNGNRRPFLTLAYAQSLDGMIAATASSSATSNMQLSCPESMTLTHHLRNMHDAILVGGSTFLIDQPRLNCRLRISSSYSIEHPLPIVLDTNLNNLQRLLFDDDIVSIIDEDHEFPDIIIDSINAYNPIVCCSSNAAKHFLDILEIFQNQQETKRRKRKKSYKITVCKMIDEDGDHEKDLYMPIKITIHITHHNGKKQEEDTVQDLTVTLLPCQLDTRTNSSLDLKHVLNQLYSEFAIESVMVEGGAGILSSFMNACVNDDKKSKVVDCICITTAPKIIGGKWGLPVFKEVDVLSDLGDDRGDEDDESINDIMIQRMITFQESKCVSLGTDSIFLGRIV